MSDDVISILFLAANPKDTTQLALNKEYKNIRNELLKSPHQHLFDIRIEPAASLKDLSEILHIYKPHIVHFSGHGESYGALIFEDDNGHPEEAPIEYIGGLFSIFKKNIQIVLLNACYSQSQAREIVKHIPIV